MTEPIDRALNLAEKFAQQLTDLAKETAPQAWELAQTAAWLSAFQYVVYGAIWFGVGVLAALWLRFSWRRNKFDRYGDPNNWFLGTVVAWCIGAFAAGAVLFNWGSVWVWAGLIEPKLWIAYKILKL